MAPEGATGPARIPALSAVTVIRDHEAELEAFVDRTTTLLDARCEQWELVVVDDASSDGSLGLIQTMAVGHPEIRVLVQTSRLGEGRSLRRAMDAARFMVVALLEVGEIVPPTFLGAAWQHLHRFDVVAGWRPRTPPPSAMVGALERVWRRLVARSLGLEVVGDGPGPIVLRRSAAEVIRLHGEDIIVRFEVLARAARAGLRCLRLDTGLAVEEGVLEGPPWWRLTRAARQLHDELG